MGSDWLNTWSNVFQSVGTVGAFVTGFVLLRRELKREADRTEDERRAQAAKVSAWVEMYRRTDGTRELALHVHNASDMPIYEVDLPLPVPAGEDPETEFIGLVPPGQTIRRPAPRAWLTSYTEPEPVEIEFQDSMGRQWRRDEQGALVRTSGQRTIEPR